MTSTHDPRTFHRFGDRLTAAGIHLNLTDALRHHIVLKAGRLLRHAPRIDAVHLELRQAAPDVVVVSARVESAGSALQRLASAADPYLAVNQVTARLDRALRKRTATADSRPRARTATPWPARPTTPLSPAP